MIRRSPATRFPFIATRQQTYAEKVDAQDAADATKHADEDATQGVYQGAGSRRILGRITGIHSIYDGVALYSWEHAVPITVGDTSRNEEGFSSDTSIDPAWEVSRNSRVPLDGTAVVELFPSAGGLYYSFHWPERFTPGRVVSSAGLAHAWTERVYGAGGTQSDMTIPSGRSGTTTVNPAYERNRAEDVPADTEIWLERGYGACPDIVTAITVPGDGVSVYQVQVVTLSNTTGGTWTLTIVDGNGTQYVVGPFTATSSAATIQTAIRAANGYFASVTVTGSAGGPYTITFVVSGFVNLPAAVGDPFQLAGVQEWWFDHTPCVRSSFIEFDTDCIGGRLKHRFRSVTVGCGEATFYDDWITDKDLGPCPPDGGALCKGIVGVQTVQVDTQWIDGILYKYIQTVTFAYDDKGCLGIVKTPIVKAPVACFPSDCSGSGSSGECDVCAKGTAPPGGFALHIAQGDFGTACPTLYGDWVLSQVSPCYWKGVGGAGGGLVAELYLVENDLGQVDAILSISYNEIVFVTALAQNIGKIGLDCCRDIELLVTKTPCNANPKTLTLHAVGCDSGSSGTDCIPAPACDVCDKALGTPSSWSVKLVGFDCGTCEPTIFNALTVPDYFTVTLAGTTICGDPAHGCGVDGHNSQPNGNYTVNNNIATRCRWTGEGVNDANAYSHCKISIEDAGGGNALFTVDFTDGDYTLRYSGLQNGIPFNGCPAEGFAIPDPISLTSTDCACVGYPDTITLTPHNCTNGQADPEFSPDGAYTMQQLADKPCGWADTTSVPGYATELYFTTDPFTGWLSISLVIRTNPGGAVLATYGHLQSTVPFDCCSPITLSIADAGECSSYPRNLVINPGGCCTHESGSGGGIDTDCCDGPVPSILNVSLTDPCAGDISLQLEYQSVGSAWSWNGNEEGVGGCGSKWQSVVLSCLFGQWRLSVTSIDEPCPTPLGGQGEAILVSCDPLMLQFDFTYTEVETGCPCCANGTFRTTAIVTE